VTEEPALRRPHLEEAEVLAVLRVRVEAGLAPGNSHSLVAPAPEHPADDLLRRLRARHREPPRVRASPQRRGPGSLPRECAREVSPVERDLALGFEREPRVGKEPAMLAEEPQHLPVALDRRRRGDDLRVVVRGGRTRRRRQRRRGKE